MDEPILDNNIGHVQNIDIEREMRTAYLDYAMSVIVSRALPDARDGLKPVHRRIMYAMHDMGVRPGTPYRKSARIVGDVLGKYHPHSNTAVYDAMARLAQDFSMRYPLVDGQGNFGSVDGDNPAAMRYTEARLAAIAGEILVDIDRDTIDWKDNFDGSMQEPIVLPARIPNMLLNGSNGIAVGMATNIPPHNLTELCDALAYMIDHYDRLDDVTVEDLMRFVKGPDFPTGLLARNAAARGLTRKPWVKTSLAPGSKVVSDYLAACGLNDDLDALGFNLVGYDLSAQRRAEQGRSRAHGRGAHPAVAVRARSALQQLAGAHQVPAQPILVGQSLERPEREVRNFRFAIIERSEQQPHIQADRDTAQSLGRAQAHARVAMAQTGASGQFSGQARVGQLRQRQLRLVTDLGLFVGERAEHEAPSLRRSEGHQLFERALALVGALRPKFGGERLQRIAASARRVGRNERRRA
jgi:hypothetical protein